jgi:hypothetical protein
MAFTPDNALEDALLRAAAEPSARPEFYRRLLDSNLTVLGNFGENMSIETVSNEQGNFHPIFTNPERMKEFSAVELPNFAISGRTLFEATRGAQFVINPGSGMGKTLSAEEIAWCLQSFPSTSLIVAQPKVFPTKLIKALCVLFTSRTLIRAAHLVYVAREGIDQEAHPMIGLEADGDVPRLAQEIFAAAEAVLPAVPVEVVYLDPKSELDPFQKHVLSVPPFYQRALPSH